jgi:hypothetical protein
VCSTLRPASSWPVLESRRCSQVLEEECTTRLVRKCGPFGGEPCYGEAMLPRLGCKGVGRYKDRNVKFKIKHS